MAVNNANVPDLALLGLTRNLSLGRWNDFLKSFLSTRQEGEVRRVVFQNLNWVYEVGMDEVGNFCGYVYFVNRLCSTILLDNHFEE
jgi:hypothetical protein